MPKTIHTDFCILGAGLAGLSLAYLLREKNISIRIVEARSRAGGRIFTKARGAEAPQEMGATWFGKKHKTLIALLEELKLSSFEQILGKRAIYEPISTSPPQLVTLPPNQDPSFRIAHGSSTLIQALKNNLKNTKIHFDQAAMAIEKNEDGITVATKDLLVKSKILVSTLPPFLLLKSIKFSQTLPQELIDVATRTHTWMGESIKVGLNYKKAFWREKNSSGTIFSNVGPIPEMYDHANIEESAFGLKGFLNGTYFSLSKEERLELVLKQLEKYYGPQARDFINYEETVWRNEPYTYSPYSEHILPHQNNGHAIFRKAYLDGRLFIAGSETAASFPGYMDGAVESAAWVKEELEKNNIY